MKRLIAIAGLVIIVGAVWRWIATRPVLIEAAQFWEIYFQGGLSVLEHADGWWVGRARMNPVAHVPTTLLKAPKFLSFRVSGETLRAYNYQADPRFTLFSAAPSSLADAFEGVINGTYPYRDPTPLSGPRLGELFSVLRKRYDLAVNDTLTLDALEQLLSAMIARQSEGLDQSIAALVWFLGERRQRASSSAVIDVVRNSGHLRPLKLHIHFTAVDAAFSSLWKINDKSKLVELLSLMRQADDSGRRKFAALFERLLSTRELLSLQRCGSAWATPEFWEKIIEPRRMNTLADWDRYDAGSPFWELRYLAAVRVPADDPVLATLASDEVDPVRQQAQRRSRFR